MTLPAIGRIIRLMLILFLVALQPIGILAASDSSVAPASEEASRQGSSAILPNDFKSINEYDYSKIDYRELN
ncbi:MAG: hypothetical protein EHM14_02310, partial [Methanothrix sp.]